MHHELKQTFPPIEPKKEVSLDLIEDPIQRPFWKNYWCHRWIHGKVSHMRYVKVLVSADNDLDLLSGFFHFLCVYL